MNLYENLGVHKNAPKSEIKKAYRRKAMKAHPDRKGGDAEKFHAIQKAYEVLTDDSRRAHYDATGQDGQSDRQGDLYRRLAALFMHFVESADVDHADIIVLMKQALLDGKNKTAQALKQQEAKIAKYERTKKRLKKKGEGENVFIQMLDGQIGIVQRGIEVGKTDIGVVDEMIKMLADYQYSADGQTQYATMQSLASMAFGTPWQT